MTTDLNDPTKTLQLAIVSDMHCHLESHDYGKESFQIVGSPRTPAYRHPVGALLSTVQPQLESADLLLCPGDITNRANREGLSEGIMLLREMATKFQDARIICTLGNHDISRQITGGPPPMELAQTIHPDFPIENGQLSTNYWAHGFSVIEHGDDTLIAVINSVADHVDEVSAKRGSFSDARLASLRLALAPYVRSSSRPFRIAMLHHHPLLHSYADFSEDDVLANGDQLLATLSEAGFGLVLHGHRHQPRLTRYGSGGNSMLVFACGSFSAMLRELSPTTRNLFHYLTLKTSTNSGFVGEIKSWEYNYVDGWNPASQKASKLPHIQKFSLNNSSVPLTDIRDFFSDHNIQKIEAADFLSAFPAVDLFLPDEIQALDRDLAAQFGIKIVFNDLGHIHEIGKMVNS